jgi:F-type H+-transporting ATPase subunit delta
VKLGEGTIVRRYARALFAGAVKRGAVDDVRRDLQSLNELWADQPELKVMLLNPGLSQAKVQAILNALAEKLQLGDVSRRFVSVLLEKDRLEILPQIQPVFEQLVFEQEGWISVTVTTAVTVDSSLQARIVSHLKQKSGREPVVAWRQDPELLGGLVIQWPDHVYDASLARKLLNMTAQLSGTS